MTTSDAEALQTRVAALEKKLKRTSIGWVMMLVLLLVGGIGVERAMSQAQSLQASRLDIVDSAGHTRLTLGFDTTGRPGMWMYDNANKTRVFIGFGSSRATPAITLLDDTGRTRLFLGFGATGNITPQVTLSDEAGKPRIYAGWNTQEQPFLNVTDQAGKTIWTAP